MALDQYLTKRPNSQNWQLRLMVPLQLRSALGRSEFTKSMGTPNRREAEHKAHGYIARWRAQIERAEHSHLASIIAVQPGYPPSSDELLELAVEVGYLRADKKADQLIAKALARGEEGFEDLHDALLRNIKRYRMSLLSKDWAAWRSNAENQLDKRGWNVAHDEPAYQAYMETYGKAAIDTLLNAKAKLEGQDEQFSPSTAVRNVSQRKAERAKPGETILELFELYGTQKVESGEKRATGVDQDRMVITLFANHVGVNRSVASITITEARDFRNTVALLPRNYLKLKAYRGLSIREAAEKAKVDGLKAISPVTRERYLSTISPFFDWLKSEGYTDHQPFQGLHQRPQKGKNPRPPYSVDQLNTIFSSPLFVGFEADGREHKPGNVRADDWRYWIPLICLFTGARISEIAQLRLDDIRQEGNCWLLTIREDEKAGQRTKSRKSRTTAVHSRLIGFGFLDFIERQRKREAENGRLFPDLDEGKRGQFGDKPSRWWRDYLKDIGVKKGADGMGVHSFRHTMADQLRLAGYLDDELGSLVLGHSNKTVTSGYGQLRQGTIERIQTMVESVRFEGVNLDHLGSR